MNTSTTQKLTVSSSPHIQSPESTRSIMYTVSLFLMPAAIFGILSFGISAFFVILSSITAALLTEIIIKKIRKINITITDGSAFLTGLLLGMSLPPTVPLYIPIISSIFAIGIVKEAFGGLGQNWANPAIAGRVFAFVSWGKEMTTWATPFTFDGSTGATPLGIVKSAIMDGTISSFQGPLDLLKSIPGINGEVDYMRLFFGYKGGCIGEVSLFLLIIGGLFLIYKGIVTIDIPISFIGTVIIMSWALDGTIYGGTLFSGDPLFHVLTGGIIIGALFMATDMVTTPISTRGRIIFGIGCGFLTMIIRLKGGYPEGVSLAILFMNMLTPTIDRIVKIKQFGFIKKTGGA